jgi:hypothetical protein
MKHLVKYSKHPMLLAMMCVCACAPLSLLGIPGLQGPPGPAGPQGPAGPSGPQGTAGNSVVFSEQPSTAPECPDGGTDITITSGTTAVTTSVCNGINSTPVTAINLCPGNTTYPDVFVEIALCINSQLYAVYSIPGSFLTLIPPGRYSSNAIGSACDLTVSPNCVVTY